jgi:hypothetical protein
MKGIDDMTTDINYGIDENEALVYVFEPEECKLHASFKQDDGKILIVEHIPGNYPSFCIATFDNIKDYKASLKGVDWITSQVKLSSIK